MNVPRTSLLLICTLFFVTTGCAVSKQQVPNSPSSPAALSVGETRDGSSQEKAIVIKAPNSRVGVASEYDFLRGRFGSFRLIRQSLLSDDSGRHFDRLHIRLADGSERTYFFDISDFFGKAVR